MGASASATVVIGFEVHHSDFWEHKVWMDDFVSCENGHEGGERGKFCSDCGEMIAFQTRRKWVPTGHFKRYCDAKNIQPDETWDPDPDCYRRGFDDLHLLCADATQDSESTRDLLVLGCEFLKVKDICSGEDDSVQSLDDAQLAKAFTNCRNVAHKLGIDRPVKLYLCGLCSF